MNAFRSHRCDELTARNDGDNVKLCGWVHRVRDHGGILFIDLRDHYGFTQILADPDSKAFRAVEKVRAEWCIRIDGQVKLRGPDLVNKKIPTGEVEVFINELEGVGSIRGITSTCIWRTRLPRRDPIEISIFRFTSRKTPKKHDFEIGYRSVNSQENVGRRIS